MKKYTFGFITVLALAVACFSKGDALKTGLFTEQEAEVIRAFTAAIEAEDWGKVESLLARPEKKLLQGAGKKFPFAVIRRLKAFKTARLLKDPEIRVENGKLIGIYKRLQVYGLTDLLREQLPPPVIYEQSLREQEDDDEEDAAIRRRRTKEVQRIAVLFKDLVAAIDKGDFETAVGMIDPDELDLFFDYKGALTPEIISRLSKLNRQEEKLLQIQNEKLENVHLLVPFDKSRLEKAVGRFVDAIQADNWEKALAMLTRFERKFLTGKDEKIKPEYKIKLRDLKKEEITVFFLFDEQLSGTLEWMGLGVYGEKKK